MASGRVVIEIAPDQSAPGGIASMAALTERALQERGWRVISVGTVSGANGRAGVFDSLWSLRAAWREIARSEGAVVHIHASQGGSLARKGLVAWRAHRHGNPVVFHVHGSDFDNWVRRGWLRTWWARRALARWSDVVVALSPAWRDRLTALAPGARVVVVPNAIDPLRPTAGIAANRPLVVFAGRIGQRKGVDMLLAAIRELQESGMHFRVCIAGDGEVEWARDVAAGLPDPSPVNIPGWLDNNELRETLEDAAIFVLPSLAEGLPVVLLEAMSAGLACVVSSVGAMPEAIQDGVTGLLVSPGDQQALTAALGRLIGSATRREQLGAAARKVAVERYGAEQYGRLLDQVLSSLTRSV